MSIFRRENNEIHWMALEIEIKILVTFLNVFQRTAPGVHYYVNCTDAEDVQGHIDAAEGVLTVLRTIRNMDIGSYKTIVTIYKDELKEVKKVYRESKKEA